MFGSNTQRPHANLTLCYLWSTWLDLGPDLPEKKNGFSGTNLPTYEVAVKREATHPGTLDPDLTASLEGSGVSRMIFRLMFIHPKQPSSAESLAQLEDAGTAKK